MDDKTARELIEMAGGKVDESSLMALPDGIGCFTASFPLPKTHWLYAPAKNGRWVFVWEPPILGIRKGYHTADGLSDDEWANPSPVPPVFDPRF
jgi:hypothetical protein